MDGNEGMEGIDLDGNGVRSEGTDGKDLKVPLSPGLEGPTSELEAVCEGSIPGPGEGSIIKIPQTRNPDIIL